MHFYDVILLGCLNHFSLYPPSTWDFVGGSHGAQKLKGSWFLQGWDQPATLCWSQQRGNRGLSEPQEGYPCPLVLRAAWTSPKHWLFPAARDNRLSMGICFRVLWPSVVNSGRTGAAGTSCLMAQGKLVGIAEHVSRLVQIFLLILPFWKDSLKQAPGKICEGLVLEMKQIHLQHRHSTEHKTSSSHLHSHSQDLTAHEIMLCTQWPISSLISPWLNYKGEGAGLGISFFFKVEEQMLSSFVLFVPHESQKVSKLLRHPREVTVLCYCDPSSGPWPSRAGYTLWTIYDQDVKYSFCGCWFRVV